MTKESLITCYQFLGNNVKMAALSDAGVRQEFIRFFRGLRQVANPIMEEIAATSQPPLDQAADEVYRQILGEEVTAELPKIKEEMLMTFLAESKVEVPVIAVLNSFEGLLED